MRQKNWADRLWGETSTARYLLLASIVLLFGMLGARELWTQEHRWAEIVATMFYTHDFFHPMLDGHEYYDKPLLSYWLIAGFSYLTGKLNLIALRLPSAFAGLFAIGAIYVLGCRTKNKSLGLLAAWMLLTTYYFLFWARVSSADMLNLAGALCAVAWYATKRLQGGFFAYTVFFLILAVTALCKGLVGPVVALIVIVPDLFLRQQWRKFIDWRLVAAMIPALIVYVLPFIVSTYVTVDGYRQNGLYEVYRENIVRYFQPYDHKGPIYTYFIYLPVYLLPWTFFFIPALVALKQRWKMMSNDAKWMAWATLFLFLFFTLSGSRRSYYILPMIPYAILFTAEWIVSGAQMQSRRAQWAGNMAMVMLIISLGIYWVFQPIYYSQGGVAHFEKKLKSEVTKIAPWEHWKIALLDTETKVSFYLMLSPDVKNIDTHGARQAQTRETLLRDWSILTEQPSDTIIITRKYFGPLLRDILQNYWIVEAEPKYFEFFSKDSDADQPLAFIPKKFAEVS